MKKNKPLLHDPFIINRVKQYLEENVDKTYVDVAEMTKHLQERYPEYARRKNAPFRALVEKAYRVVSHSYGSCSQPTSGDESDGSDLEVMDDAVSNNLMNNMMNSLYGKAKAVSSTTTTTTPTTIPSKASEAIDISSDESADDGCTNGKLKTAEVSGMKTFRDVTLSKLTNIDTSSKASSSTSVTIETMPNKRGCEIPPPTGQPNKKRKPESSATHQQTQQQQNMQRIAGFNQNSNDSTTYPGGVHMHHQQRARKYKKEVQLRKSRESFQDIGGMEKTLKELCELLMHIKSPDIYFVLGLMPPRGILLHGPPGCGKTLLAHAIAGQLNLPLIETPATELIAGVSGESEERIRDVFEQATTYAPCVLFIDEIDAISSNRSMAQKDMERRVVSQLISSLDNLKSSEGGQSVLVIGATTRPDVLDPALRRVGRFDHEIAIGIPTRKDRKDILTIICDGLSLEPKIDFDKIAELTPGYVGADLLALVSRAATLAVKKKCSEQMRAFQAKRNITIVDLDDEVDDDAEGKAFKSTKETETETSSSKSAEESDDKESTQLNNGVVVTEKPNDDASLEAMDTNENEIAEKVVEQVNQSSLQKKAEVAATGLEPVVGEADAGEAVTVAGDAVVGDAVVDSGAAGDGGAVVDSGAAGDGGDAGGAGGAGDTGDAADAGDVADAGDAADAGGDAETLAPVDADADAAGDEGLVAEKKTHVRGGEPTLFEMLNWLDNPPEDITFVSDICITLDDFCKAVKLVQPSAKREGFITVPDVTWDDIGSLQDIREELKLAVLAPVKFPEKLARLGLNAPSGVLLCGPPGCGKTLLAKAVANEAGINFISVKGPELMNMYVGESERAVRACFQRARNSAPCVIFFDEFDSLCPKRADGNEGGSGTRVVNQLLTEMDGVEERQGVYILAATNRPDIIDPAILRPGRLDTILYVGLPKKEDRLEILQATTKNGKRPVIADDVDFADLAAQTDGYTGADLAGLVQQAAMMALKESLTMDDASLEDLCVRNAHFQHAIKMLRPSVSAQDRKVYEKLRMKYAAPRVPTPTI